MTRPVITFLTDFGVTDDFVGTCHGVMKRITPDAEIIDITHGIGPQQVLQGALVLRNTLPYMPEGVHLAVVDPGVGTDRKGIVLRGEDGRLYVGPDNGLLVPAAESMGGVAAAWEVTDPRTFHGRDVFAPAAAHLAGHVAPEELGPALDPAALVRLDVPVADVSPERIVAHAVIVDRFGNVQLNLTAGDLEQIGIVPGTQIELEVGLERYYAVAARTFAEAGRGDIVLYEDSYRTIAVAINEGDAASVISARPGDEVRLRIRA